LASRVDGDPVVVVIDADGNIARAMYGVKPEGNAEEVLEALPG